LQNPHHRPNSLRHILASDTKQPHTSPKRSKINLHTPQTHHLLDPHLNSPNMPNNSIRPTSSLDATDVARTDPFAGFACEVDGSRGVFAPGLVRCVWDFGGLGGVVPTYLQFAGLFMPQLWKMSAVAAVERARVRVRMENCILVGSFWGWGGLGFGGLGERGCGVVRVVGMSDWEECDWEECD
ncbi:hypothetical protein P280DRAFT_538875, partial [Massarina eburnea CBS 473.64]